MIIHLKCLRRYSIGILNQNQLIASDNPTNLHELCAVTILQTYSIRIISQIEIEPKTQE